ncbi:E3 ubiquitin-protein ligase RNF220, partial [Elysia marginata]
RTGVDEEEPVDVEGEFEEYEWAGQTRVRATSMLEGGFSGSGFQTSKKGSDEDAELNVDGDDTEEYGKPQSSGQSTSALLSALRLKLQDMQAEKAEKQKCLICMEAYKTPLTSIQCWHVHCENCWMRTL